MVFDQFCLLIANGKYGDVKVDASDLKNMMEIVFKQAYQLGKEDMLDGVHICSNVLFQQFIEDHFCSVGSPLLESSFFKDSQ